MRAGLRLNYYRHITEEAELFFFFSLVCNFLALRDTHTLIKQSKNEKLTFSLVVNWKSCLPALCLCLCLCLWLLFLIVLAASLLQSQEHGTVVLMQG